MARANGKVQTLLQKVEKIGDDVRKATAAEIGAALDERMAFEKSKNNDHIQKTLAKSRARLAMPTPAAFLLAANVDVNFVNRSLNDGKRYNVYAIEKVADLVNALDKGVIRNAINNAVCRSLFQFRAANEAFTGEMAKAAASDKIRVEPRLAKLLVRHTVSASTAPTQASSTMNALETLGIVANKGSVKHPVYELTDSVQTSRLEEVLKAA